MFADNSADNKVDLSKVDGIGGVDIDNLGATLDETNKPVDFTNEDLTNFFNAIDQQVNGAIYNNELPTTLETPVQDLGETQEVDQKSESKPDPVRAEVAELRKELDEVKTRYSDSSREGKKLYEENREMSEYRDYIPILKKMREDPGLINHVRNYLDGNVTPRSVTEELNLPEEFVFDGDEAIKNPNSDSARVLQSMISKGIEQKLRQHTDATNREKSQEDAMRSFRSEVQMSDGEFEEFVGWARQTPLTLRDIYYLKNRDVREREIAKNAINEREKQLQKMQGTPRSVTALGSHAEPIDEDRIIFNAIKKASGGLNIFSE
jgi:hypothetical protein